MGKDQIVVVGDSHTHALRVVLKRGWTAPRGWAISARRFLRLKNGSSIGDVSFEAVLDECAALGPGDLLVSMVDSNHSNIVGLIQHPEPFDMVDADTPPGPGALIPRAAFRAWFEQGLRVGDCARVIALAQAGGAHRTLHLAPPPPKADVAHILNRPETHFTANGIHERGVSPAPLRLRLWQVQIEATRAILAPYGIDVLDPPPGTRTPEGYLRPEFYGEDATHANAAYGARVLDQITAPI
jgi:hypothetical protein